MPRRARTNSRAPQRETLEIVQKSLSGQLSLANAQSHHSHTTLLPFSLSRRCFRPLQFTFFFLRSSPFYLFCSLPGFGSSTSPLCELVFCYRSRHRIIQANIVHRESFDNIYLDLSKQPGKCKLAESGMGWRPVGGGDTWTLDSSNIGAAQWSRAAKGYELKILSRSSGVIQLDGFEQEVSSYSSLSKVGLAAWGISNWTPYFPSYLGL